MIKEVRIPEISENVTSGKVVKVLVQEGDRVDVDDILIEFETEKALVEIPSTAKGKIVELPVKEGQELRVGDVIARVETEEEGEERTKPDRAETKTDAGSKEPEAESTTPDDSESRPAAAQKKRDEEDAKSSDLEKEPPSREDRPPAPAAPSVRRFARELGIDIHEVHGTGPGGRITESDVKAFVKEGREAAGQTTALGEITETALPDFARWGDIETVELPGVRKLTARSTALSWRLVPHVTQFDKSDITALETFLGKNGPSLKKKDVKLTVTAVLAKVCAAGLLKFPRFNASIDMASNRMIFKKYVHIGIAVDTERGLLVPVIRHADKMSIRELATAIADLAERSRNKKIKPDEMEGGTFTISNQGAIGGTQFTPIVMWPQAAILGVSRSTVEPVYMDGQFHPRTVLPLALSYDHRIIDGADAARFLKWICECLEQPFNLHL